MLPKPRENPINATILGEIAQNRCLGWQCMDEGEAEDTVSSCGPERSIYRSNNSGNNVPLPNGEKQDESREDCNIPIPKNPLMLVEMIANKKDRKRVANYFNRDGVGDPFTCICYMEMVILYGFDHIIFIGECYARILFLDCYGRVFEWDLNCNVLWSLGNYWNVVSKGSPTRRVIWSVEYDGTVTEFKGATHDLPNELIFDKPATKTMDVHPVVKKKKNSKKKRTQKRNNIELISILSDLNLIYSIIRMNK
ncbi:hypothetical protein C1645_733975 [Glomus cerebriforme]|uniref:Uncharacterized protein n=1 Tax=Glomus cerebriforme TaxID=658196 RepID=A0A397TL81_9GLOM|nr:hypothetical protein C1645_733975 [Glomus cerebriforme]